MFGINTIKKEYLKLKSQLLEIQTKESNLITPNLLNKYINLFDFNNSNDIAKAISTVPELASMLNYIGKTFATGIYKHKINDKEILDSEILKLVNNPNAITTGAEFKQTFAEHLLSFGVVYLYMNTPGYRDRTTSFTMLESNKCRPYVGKIDIDTYLNDAENIIKYYEYRFENTTVKLNKNSIIAITFNSNYSIEGGYLIYESPLKPLEHALKVTPAIYDTMQNLNNNLGMTGFISNKTNENNLYIPIGDKEKKELTNSLSGYGTKSGQSHIAFANYDLKYIPISSPINQMLLPEQQKMIKTIIADILGFDTLMLNNSDGNKYANYAQARTSLFSENIKVIADKLTETLTNYFFKYKKDKIYLDYSHLDIFEENKKIKSEIMQNEINYIISLNSAVSQNYMTSENAIELLVMNNYDYENAKKIIK